MFGKVDTTETYQGALADFVAEWTDTPELEAGENRSLSPGSEAPDGWVMYFDGAFACQGAGAGAVLISPTQDKLYYAVQVRFQRGEKVSNNIAEYEGLIAGVKAVETPHHQGRLAAPRQLLQQGVRAKG